MLRTVIDVALHERAILIKNGKPVRALAPGRHVVWGLGETKAVHWDTRALVADLPDEHARLLPADEIMLVRVAAHERALVVRRGRPARWLGAGQHVVWTVDKLGGKPAVQVEVIDTAAVTTEPLRDDVKALVPASDYAEVLVPDGHVALRSLDGAVDVELGPGRHAAWTTRRRVAYQLVDLREQILAITGQEVMTKDKVTLRVNASATWRVVDARLMARAAKAPAEALYLAVQLALREAVAGHGLDELLARRELLEGELLPALQARAPALGLALDALGVKDLVLPGDMRTLLNRVIEAQKEAEANVILRREETNAVRSLAQTAKLLGESPLLLRLKELEAYTELAQKVGTVHLVMGEAGLAKLELKM